jgi:hypothetical protein
VPYGTPLSIIFIKKLFLQTSRKYILFFWFQHNIVNNFYETGTRFSRFACFFGHNRYLLTNDFQVMTIFHKMKAWLYRNILTADNPNDFFARVHAERSLGTDDVSQSAVSRGGADIRADAMTHAVVLWLKELTYLLCDGFSVNTGWFSVHPVIKGSFDSPTAKFDPKVHTIVFEFKQGSLLRKELASAEVVIMGVAETALFIAQAVDVKTGSVNELLTPNRNLRIYGSKIKIAGDSPLNGVVFVNTETKKRTRVNSEDVVNNNPSELLIVIPELEAGSYQVEITSQYSSSGTSLKDPKTTVFDRILTVT